MHFKISKQKLNNFLDITSKALPSRTTMPILNNIFIAATDQNIIMIANNLDLGIKCTVPADLYNEGKSLMSREFIDIAYHLPTNEIDIKVEQENYKATISADTTIVQLFGADPDKYPFFVDFTKKDHSGDQQSVKKLLINQKDLKTAIQQTVFAVSDDEGRPAFNGVHFLLNKKTKTLTLTASDTYRVVIKKIKAGGDDVYNCSEGHSFKNEFIVPSKNLRELAKILKDDGKVSVYFDGNKIFFEFSSIILCSRLIDEKFPNISVILPENYKTKVIIKKQELKDAVSRAALLAKGENKPIVLEINNQSVSFEASSEIGKTSERLDIKSEGESLKIMYNARFILDFLKVIGSEVCILEFSGENKPLVICPDGDDSQLAYYLVLPIKS